MLKDNYKIKNNSLIFTGVLLFFFFVSVEKRNQQFAAWERMPDVYFVGERPMMTTLDAPFWLRWAREYNEGTFGQKERLRQYPDKTQEFLKKSLKNSSTPLKYKDSVPAHLSEVSPFSKKSKISYSDVPLLSFLIAKLSKFFNQNYYLTGTLLIPFLASLFILPLGYFFFLIGVPVSGLLGGLVGTFSGAYYMRSSIGRIDTDMLNIFFPSLMALLILLASKAKNKRLVFLYSILAGLCLLLFDWWYSKPGFTLVYFIILVFCLFVQKIRFITILLGSLLFILFLKPENFIKSTGSISGFLKDYIYSGEKVTDLVKESESNPASFPNTSTTISEVNRVPMNQVLKRVLSSSQFAWAGFIAFFGLAFFRWRVMLPLLPMLALGSMGFFSANRFIMYLAPFIGIGLGWLLQLGAESMFFLISKYIRHRHLDKDNKLKRKKGDEGKISFWEGFCSILSGEYFESRIENHSKKLNDERGDVKNFSWKGRAINWWNLSRQMFLYLFACIFFWLISGQTAISFIPGPSIHPRIYSTFLEIKNQVPENSALLTWWDYGYAITDATGLATFHDGGSQFGPKTYFTARGIISDNQNELHKISQFLATEGYIGILENNKSPESLLDAVHNPKYKPWDPIYFFFTADMTGKYGAISKLGSWDIKKGGSKPRVYQNLECNKITNREMFCRGAKIDLIAGFINNQLALRRLVFIRDGQVIREKDFGHNQGFTIQLIVVGKNIVEVHLIDEFVYSSNYNQMFYLGRYRNDLFEEIFNASPFSRLYKIKY